MLEAKIKYSKDALKFLSRLDKKSITRIREAIDGLKQIPPIGDIKTMQGYDDDRKRLRIGSWRDIYRLEIDGCIQIIYVINIGNRGDIYK